MRISDTHHTARFVCTTDTTGAQFASFYPGAMSEARLMELAPIVADVGAPSYVLIGADDPDGMLRHTDECRQRGFPFIADPSQQLAFSEGELIRSLIDGAAYLFSNEYESHMIEQKTGWSAAEVLDRVGTQVTTLGAAGVRITSKDGTAIELHAAKDVAAVEPTGVGDAFRAGFLAALAWGLSGGARGPGGLRPRGVRRGDGRSAGLHVHGRAVPGAAGHVVRRRRRRGRAAPSGVTGLS